MKKLFWILALLSNVALADDCRVTSASVETDGQFKTETITVCKEGEVVAQKVKIGDTVLENEMGSSNASVKYFTYRNTRCRLFTERLTEKGKLRVNHGVMCQVDNSPTNWLIVDKW